MWNLLVVALLPLSCWGSTAESTPSATTINESLERLGLQGIRPNPFVAASPLIVAAVCSDGIAMVAIHAVSTKEKLLRDFRQDEAAEAEKNKSENAPINSFAERWKDLPKGHGGPYRINKIDRCGTHLLSAGWRADCDLLTEKILSIASNEVAVYGPPKSGLPYGRFLAQEASLWMAQLAVSDSLRPLSCVGLLAACGAQKQKVGFNGSLWFVDVTGAYRVRALAIGGGKAEGRGDESCIVAQLVNAQLEKTDFSTMAAKEGVGHILRILCGQTNADDDNAAIALVPSGCEMEIGCITQQSNLLQRLRLPALDTTAQQKA